MSDHEYEELLREVLFCPAIPANREFSINAIGFLSIIVLANRSARDAARLLEQHAADDLAVSC